MKQVKTRALIGLLGVLCFVRSGYGIIIHDGGNDQDYIDLGNQYRSTVWAAALTDQGNVARGSAVVIDDGHWVLTAAHNYFASGRNPLYNGAAYIGTGSHVYDEPGSFFVADQWYCHPSYSGVATSPDLALLYFEDGIAGMTAADLHYGTPSVGDLVTQVGYGASGTPATGQDVEYGQRRGSVNLIDRIGYSALDVPDYYALTEFIPDGVTGYQELGGVGAGGDSGGGWYIDGELFAITSFEIGSPGYYGDTGATMIEPHMDWIYQTTGIPEPATLTLICTFGGAVLFIRRRVMM